LMEHNGYRPALYGHFGDGCVHTRIPFDLRTPAGIAKFRSFIEEASDLVVKYGGSFSGEHGDGQSRAELLPKLYGPEVMDAFNEFKSLWDPAWKMNPGKVIKPRRLDEDLRIGTTYRPPDPATHFQFPENDYSFAETTLRCVGVGKCRQMEEGTMCPSYRVTLDEEHSTRGRARLLFEMLERWPLAKGWRDDHVREALELCLACKGCLSDCPVNVDMATYKAEFMSHHYEGHLRPRDAYSMGLIYWWARLAARIPHLANFVTQTPGLARVVKQVGGLDTRRQLPPFAAQTFTDWFGRRPRGTGHRDVVLWPDTFNNFFMPETAKAAVEVLESAGCSVRIPQQSLCCGRPLYDFGFLDLAKVQLKKILEAMRADIAAGTPVVGLEPSCVAVFRNELVNLFPHDQDAQRLSRQMMTLAEFLTRECPGYAPPPLHRKAVLHGHCHQKAVMGLSHEIALLEKMKLDLEMPDSGCCGMAGSFGFKHFDLSAAIGERGLLPAVRRAPQTALVIADGYSCREQVHQLTSRRAIHLAQVLQMALREGPQGPQDPVVESGYPALINNGRSLTVWEAALGGLAIIVGVALIKERS
jgi:Fe-S oxidoreductase